MVMKRTWKPIPSVLLAFALIIPLGATAQAATTVSLSLNPKSGSVLYFRDGHKDSVTITATASEDFDGDIVWSTDEGEALLDMSPVNRDESASFSKGKSITVKPVGYAGGTPRTGTVTVTAKLTGKDASTATGTCTIEVREDKAKSCDLSVPSKTIFVGGDVQAAVEATYDSGAVDKEPKAAYTSSDEEVATVSASGLISGVSTGSATITATVGTVSSEVKVTVTNPTADFTDSATTGEEFSMSGIYRQIYAQYGTTFASSGVAARPSRTAQIEFEIPSNRRAVLRDGAGRSVVSGDKYPFSSVDDMTLDAYDEGTYTVTYTVTDGTRVLEGEISIEIATPTRHIRIPISGRTNYSFDSSSEDPSGRTAEQLIDRALGDFGSIRFDSVRSGANVGTLYTGSGMSRGDRVDRGTIVNANRIGELYFSPSRSGVFIIGYSAYSDTDGEGTVLASGEMIIAVDSESLDVTINLDDTEPYTFSKKLGDAKKSAADLINDAIDDAVGSSVWNYIRFDGDSSGDAVGTLHETSSTKREISSARYIHYLDIGSLYFVPERVGVYKVGYSVYSDDDGSAAVASGTLSIDVTNIPAGDADVTYTTSTGGKVTFDEDDFIDFFRSKLGSRYYLSSVVFDDYNGDGSFYHDTAAFVPYNSADYYTRSYTGRVSDSARYLDRVSFTAPRSPGYTAVKFTCYGGRSAGSMDQHESGVLYILYTAASVPAVSYNAYGVASVTLRESDFISVYKTAMNASSAPRFYIRLENLPTSGVFYQNYSAANRGTLFTSSGLRGFTLSVGGGGDSVETISYVPINNGLGADTVTYTAYNISGTPLYSGTIRFKLTPDRTATVTSDGLTFTQGEFYSPADADPVIYVTFAKPAYGKMYAIQNGRLQAVTENTRFYTAFGTDGAYPVTAARYVPRAGRTDEVTLTYTAHTRSGASYENAITVSLRRKTASDVFNDVTPSDVGTWAADAVDFANRLGLVKGTSSNPPKFSPRSTMRRCDLVLILYRLAGEPVVSGSMPYSDVSAKAYYYNSALWASQKGIMDSVVTGNKYDPSGAITRQDFAKILFNYTKAMGVSTANNGDISGYVDASQVSANTRDGVIWAVANGYITSDSSTVRQISPARAANRAEIVTLLHRYLTY